MIARLLVLLVLAMSGAVLAPSARAGEASQLQPGSGRFEHRSAGGTTIPVYYHIPAGASADAPILFVMHGVNRDADRYRDEWIAHAEAEGMLVFAPQFSQADFPGSRGYNLGRIGGGGWLAARPDSPYTIVDGLFDAVRARTGTTRQRYFLYGHSAGAQFVHRFVYFMPEARIEAAIAANAGWYTMPDLGQLWPYGLDGTGMTEKGLERALAQPLHILLGVNDRDRRDPNLRRTREAMAQGPHRFARGQTFMDAASLAAPPGGFGWRVGTVPGAAHNNAQMIPAAIAIITGKGGGTGPQQAEAGAKR